GVMKGSAELLNQRLESSDDVSRELSEYIYTEVSRLSALVSRFLDFARPSRLELHSADLTAVVERSLKAVEQQGATSQVKITREYAPSLPPVRVDQELCEQAFTNLLFNACEAMGETGGELKIRVLPANRGKEVVTEIEDTGPGVPADMREQIFNPFVSTKKTGVGLGLAIVSKIIDAHGGTIKLIDPPGRGACFRVTLPAG